MKAFLLTLCGLGLCMAAYGQPRTLNLDERGGYLTFTEGMRVDVYGKGNHTSPAAGFILADSVAYLISERAFLEAVFYKMKIRELEKLIVLDSLRIDNLNEQLTLVTRQLETEQQAFEGLMQVSALKDGVAQDAINKLNRFRLRSILFGGFMGVLGGLLWIRDGDGQAAQIGKPVALGGAGVFMSFSLFK